MVYARGNGSETWFDERRRTFTGGSTRDAYGGPYARRIATDALLRESEPHERTTGGGANHEDSAKGLDLWF